MKPLKHKTFVTLRDGSEETVYVEFDFTPGDPGRTYGPPEKCYPPEPAELDITAVRNEAGTEISEQIDDYAFEELIERIYDDHVAWYPQVQRDEVDYDY